MKFKGILTCMYFVDICMTYLNSLMNPFLYACRLPRYRKSIWFIFASRMKNKVSFSLRQSD